MLDPDDDHACVRALLGVHDLADGVVVCLAAPGSPWPVLARDVLLALGKDRRALDAAGPRSSAPGLLELWLRAEQVHHLVVLRAHLLPFSTLAAVDRLAVATGVQVWRVAHGPLHSARTPTTLPWPAMLALLTVPTAADRQKPTAEEQYATVRDLAARAGRAWRIYTERTRIRARKVRPDCALGVLLQNLTIDAHDGDDLLLRLHAARVGLRDAGLHLVLPALATDTRLLGYLGPRFSPETVTRLRRLACPLAVGALTLARATDSSAPWLAKTRLDWTDPCGRHVRAYTGTFRVPPQARPMLRALLLDRASRDDPPPALFIGRDGKALLGRRLAHRIRAGADLAGLPAGEAAIPREKCYTPETFATTFTGATNLQPRSKH
ncbi:hypothetical protein [Pseudonocardia sp. ICBG1034]|uniref:hypothetical protein n=1 Tax=Pseudonocardia sp. ICBG1034 TaxID=2844381 RepID=UPI001CCBDCB2|nr:hypothetical protein [Pseudonocardia sp. ICBG1034]